MKFFLLAFLFIATNVNGQDTSKIDVVVNSYLNFYKISDEPILILNEEGEDYNSYRVISENEEYYFKSSQKALIFDWDKDGSFELITFLFDNTKFKDYVKGHMKFFGMPEIEMSDDNKYIYYRFEGDYSEIKLTNIVGTDSYSISFTSLK